jgi:hypothetical protein
MNDARREITPGPQQSQGGVTRESVRGAVTSPARGGVPQGVGHAGPGCSRHRLTTRFNNTPGRCASMFRMPSDAGPPRTLTGETASGVAFTNATGRRVTDAAERVTSSVFSHTPMSHDERVPVPLPLDSRGGVLPGRRDGAACGRSPMRRQTSLDLAYSGRVLAVESSRADAKVLLPQRADMVRTAIRSRGPMHSVNSSHGRKQVDGASDHVRQCRGGRPASLGCLVPRVADCWPGPGQRAGGVSVDRSLGETSATANIWPQSTRTSRPSPSLRWGPRD